MKNNLAIEVHNLTASYNRKPVLWDIDFTLPQGKIIGVVGPNGSGKTTLLKAIMGLHKADSGYAEIFGEELNRVRNRVSYVPQRESVDWDFPASVMDVVLMGRYSKKNLFKRLNKEDRRLATEALEKVNRYNPSLVISDIMMPRMDGLEFFKQLKSNPEYSAIPFVFLTAKTLKSDVLEGFNIGADDYVTKPFDSEVLLCKINGGVE